MQDMGRYLENKEGEVAIFDATNTTRERRNWLVNFCKQAERDPKFRIFFIESVCDDPEIINSNIAVRNSRLIVYIYCFSGSQTFISRVSRA
jgi:hypothetical protein